MSPRGNAAPAIAPSAKDYAAAFYGLEDRVMRVSRLAELAGYLSAILHEDMEKRPKGDHCCMGRMVQIAAGELEAAAKDLDATFLATFNDLVGRENGALESPKASP